MSLTSVGDICTGVIILLPLFLLHLIYAVLRGSGTLAITVHVNVTVSPIV